MTYLIAFLVGGALCAAAQITLDTTTFTPAHILVGAVVLGGILGGVGVYRPFAEWAGAGATIPLPGFGYALVRGTMEAIHSEGWLGVFTGSLANTAAGIKAAVIFGFLAAVFFSSKG